MNEQPRERGAVAVEFALIVPLLVTLAFGIAEFGRAYYIQTTLSNAARDGVRTMALQDDPTAARETTKSSAGALNPSLTDDQISVTPSTTSCAATGTTPAGMAKVVVTYEMDLLTGLFGADITLTGRGTMRCNG